MTTHYDTKLAVANTS